MHRRSEATAAGNCGAPSMDLDGEHEHGVQEREAKLMALLVRSEGGLRGENSAAPASSELGHGGRTRREAKRGESSGRGSE